MTNVKNNLYAMDHRLHDFMLDYIMGYTLSVTSRVAVCFACYRLVKTNQRVGSCSQVTVKDACSQQKNKTCTRKS